MFIQILLVSQTFCWLLLYPLKFSKKRKNRWPATNNRRIWHFRWISLRGRRSFEKRSLRSFSSSETGTFSPRRRQCWRSVCWFNENCRKLTHFCKLKIWFKTRFLLLSVYSNQVPIKNQIKSASIFLLSWRKRQDFLPETLQIIGSRLLYSFFLKIKDNAIPVIFKFSLR